MGCRTSGPVQKKWSANNFFISRDIIMDLLKVETKQAKWSEFIILLPVV